MASKRHSKGYWTYETCFEEAKKYKSVKELKENNGVVYNIAIKNKWIQDYTWLEKRETKPSRYWEDYTNCYNEAKKYSSKIEFSFGSISAYKSACKHGWIKDYNWFKRPSKEKYSREFCYNEAKKYNSKIEFKKKNNGVYSKALKMGWLDDYDWFERPKSHNYKWTYDACYKSAKECKTKAEFKKKYPSAYSSARENGWLVEYIWFENTHKLNGYWTYERCYEEAKKYKNKVDFRKGNSSAYSIARKNKWIDDYNWLEKLVKPNGYWTYERCYEEAKKYSTRNELREKNSACYDAVLRNGWLNEYTWLEYVRIPNTYRFNLLEEFISEYEFRTFLENNDQNILLIIIRNLEPKYEPIKKDLEKALARTKETDPIKALRDKYMSDDEESDVNEEAENNGEENVHDITTIDMDDDEAFKAVMTEITESSEESEEEEGEKEEKELSIDDVVKNDETELKVINKIEHMLTPEDRQYIMEKFLNDRRRQWIAEREKKSCNA